MTTATLRRPANRIGLHSPFVALLVATALAGPAAARQTAGERTSAGPSARTTITADDYARAEALLGWNIRGLVTGAEVVPRWIAGDARERFWYRNRIAGGFEFILVDPAAGSRRRAFDHVRLASALSLAADTTYEPWKLPFDVIDIDPDRELRFATSDSVAWACDLSAWVCRSRDGRVADPVDVDRSPDGTMLAFEREDDLWIRDVTTGEERALTTDGDADVGWANHPEYRDYVTHTRNGIPRPPIVAWSPDSRRILTHRLDERGVERVGLWATGTGRGEVYSWRYPLPGDSLVPRFELFVFDPAAAERVRIDLPPIDMVDATCCGPMQDTVWKAVRWSPDGNEIFITRMERGHRAVELLVADPVSGNVRTVLRESARTWVELNPGTSTVPNWRPVAGGDQVIWYSQRDGWGHLYRVEVAGGQILNRITEGAWAVNDLLHVAEEAPGSGWVYFTATGRVEGRDPYYRHLYRARLDGSGIELLTPEDADHDVRMSPSGRWIVDTRSTRTSEPVTVLRAADGREVMVLEEADFSALLARGWSWPRPFTVKARDGATDLYGMLYLPAGYDPAGSYPVVDYIYPGPQVGPIGFRQADPAPGGDPHALAQLGFFVFTIDAMGTPYRSKAFHDAYFGDLADNGLPDHVTAIRQLGLEYPAMDLDRVGIFGHSGGGFSSTRAILRYPEFFKVAVSRAGNHDNRSFGYYWGEKYHGLVADVQDGGDSYDTQANQNIADRLVGKLLLMYGTLDDRVHPNANLLLIDALIDANIDFDLVVLPNRNHGFGSEPYVIRRTWDHLVRHLHGVEPPRYRILGPEG
jgi:dipeptidyl-peptidase 4